ncbi:MAG: response regulator [Elusimicrobia bacterium]|nr:response regulator [Elusimicrobiota bacterium]MDE2425558.1 response regulator [Elusimicrobiota bacterium]
MSDARESTALLRQAPVVKAAFDGLAVLDRAGRIVLLNEALAQTFGFAAAKALRGKKWSGLFSEEAARRLEAEVLPAALKRGRWRGELSGRRRDGAAVPLELSFSRIDEEGGKAAGLVCAARNVSERKRVEEEHERLLRLEQERRAQAEASSRAKDEFLAVVSHELRTPMTAILGWSWLLRHGDVSPREMSQALEIIDRNMRLQAQIIEDLLDISSVITGKLRLNVKPADLSQALEAAVEKARPAAALCGVRLEALIPPNVKVRGDAQRLRQIFWNLLSNAVKFNSSGGLARLVLATQDQRATITIKDDGRGIEPALLPEIFDLFRQGQDSLTREYRGLGLGLSIVRHLVEMHGGSIDAASPGLGKGSTFIVSLPLLKSAARETPAEAQPQAKPPRGRFKGALAGVSLLLVDDDPDTLAVLSELLDYCGAKVATALSAASALELLGRGRFDLLLCDLAMPVEDGFSLMRKIRALPQAAGLRAAALSARAGDDERRQALEAGFSRFFAKPPDLDALVDGLRALCGR